MAKMARDRVTLALAFWTFLAMVSTQQSNTALTCDEPCGPQLECRLVRHCSTCSAVHPACVPQDLIKEIFEKNRFNEDFCGIQGVSVYFKEMGGGGLELLPVRCPPGNPCPPPSVCKTSYSDGKGYCCANIESEMQVDEVLESRSNSTETLVDRDLDGRSNSTQEQTNFTSTPKEIKLDAESEEHNRSILEWMESFFSPIFGARKKRSTNVEETPGETKPEKPECTTFVLNSPKNSFNSHTFPPESSKKHFGARRRVAISVAFLLQQLSDVQCLSNVNFFHMGLTLLASKGCSGVFLVCFSRTPRQEQKSQDLPVTTETSPTTTASLSTTTTTTTTTTDTLNLPDNKTSDICGNVVMRSTLFSSTRVSFPDGLVPASSMSLERQTSELPCVAGRGYVFGPSEAVVSNGCQGVFRICRGKKVVSSATQTIATPASDSEIKQKTTTAYSTTTIQIKSPTESSPKNEEATQEVCRPVGLKANIDGSPKEKVVKDMSGNLVSIVLLTVTHEISRGECKIGDTFYYEGSSIFVTGDCWAYFRVCYDILPRPTVPGLPMLSTRNTPSTRASAEACTILTAEAQKDGSFSVESLHLENRPVASMKILHKTLYPECPPSQNLYHGLKFADLYKRHECVMVDVEVCYQSSENTTAGARNSTATTTTATFTESPTTVTTLSASSTTVTMTKPEPKPCRIVPLVSTRSSPDVRIIRDSSNQLVEVTFMYLVVEKSVSMCHRNLTYSFSVSVITAKDGCVGDFAICYETLKDEQSKTANGENKTVPMNTTKATDVRQFTLKDNATDEGSKVDGPINSTSPANGTFNKTSMNDLEMKTTTNMTLADKATTDDAHASTPMNVTDNVSESMKETTNRSHPVTDFDKANNVNANTTTPMNVSEGMQKTTNQSHPRIDFDPDRIPSNTTKIGNTTIPAKNSTKNNAENISTEASPTTTTDIVLNRSTAVVSFNLTDEILNNSTESISKIFTDSFLNITTNTTQIPTNLRDDTLNISTKATPTNLTDITVDISNRFAHTNLTDSISNMSIDATPTNLINKTINASINATANESTVDAMNMSIEAVPTNLTDIGLNISTKATPSNFSVSDRDLNMNITSKSDNFTESEFDKIPRPAPSNLTDNILNISTEAEPQNLTNTVSNISIEAGPIDITENISNISTEALHRNLTDVSDISQGNATTNLADTIMNLMAKLESIFMGSPSSIKNNSNSLFTNSSTANYNETYGANNTSILTTPINASTSVENTTREQIHNNTSEQLKNSSSTKINATDERLFEMEDTLLPNATTFSNVTISGNKTTGQEDMEMAINPLLENQTAPSANQSNPAFQDHLKCQSQILISENDTMLYSLVEDEDAGIPADIRSLTLEMELRNSSTCKKGKTFYYRSSAIFATNGCSGIFEVCYVPAICENRNVLSGPGNSPDIIDFRPTRPEGGSKTGPVTIRSLNLLETIGILPCVEWESYYYTGGLIYVRDGCHAQLEICYVDEPPPI